VRRFHSRTIPQSARCRNGFRRGIGRRDGTARASDRSCRKRNFWRLLILTANIIERAFELASEAASIDEIRKHLRREGYSNVDAHLEGPSIKADLKKRFVGQAGGGRAPV
jgi:hypothetical protein